MVDLVRLVARLDGDDSGFRATMNRASRDLNSFGAQAQRASGQARGAFAGVAAGWTSMAGVLAAVGVAAGFSELINEAARFEQQLNSIRAVTRASTAETRALSAAVRQSAANFRIGANAAASAAFELTKSGVSLSALSEGALDAAIVLAQATGGEYADAATIAARATSIFRLETEDMSHVVEGAVQVINAGHFELQDYVLALQQGGAAARDAGLSLDDFNTVLALTQNALGSSGSDTGTAARTFLSRLVPQSREAQAAMESLSLSFYDAQGAFVGIDEAAERLRVAFAGLSDQQRNNNLVTIFGVDAQRQAIALMQDGAAGLEGVRDRMAEAGSAAEQAQARTAGFAGATNNLSAAFQELGIAIGESGLNELLTNLANYAAGGLRQAAQRTRDFATGMRAITTNGQMIDPLAARIRREARVEYLNDGGDIWNPDDAIIEEIRQGILRDHDRLRAMLLDPISPQDAPLQNLDGRTYGGTWLGQQLREELVPGFNNWRPPSDIYVDGQRVLNPSFIQGPPSPQGQSSFRPPRPSASSGSSLPTGSILDDIAADQAWQDDLDDWLYEVNQSIQAAAKNELGGTLPVQIEGFETEHQRLVQLSENLASDIHNTLRDAFIDPENFDPSTFMQSIAQSFRAALWDALIGDQMQSFLQSMAYALAKSLNHMFANVGGQIGGAGGKGGTGGGFFSFIGNAISSLFSGFFAEGGYVPPGQWGIAGEQGPEPIYGGKTGVTVQAAGEGGYGGMTQVFNIDARGADAGVEHRIRIAVAEATQRGAQAGAAGVFAKVRRTTTQ